MAMSSSMVEIFLNSELGKFLMSQDFLKAGDILRGRIIELKADHMALIDFGKFRALAEIRFAVEPGESIQVKVVENGPQLILSLNHPPADAPNPQMPLIGKIEIMAENAGEKLINALMQWAERKGALLPFSDADSKPIGMEGTANEIMSGKTGQSYLPGQFSENASSSHIINEHSQARPLMDAMAIIERFPNDIRQVVERLLSFFSGLDLKNSPMDAALKLKDLIENSGLHYEKRIIQAIEVLLQSGQTIKNNLNQEFMAEINKIIQNDVKPNLMVLREFITQSVSAAESLTDKGVENIKNSIDQLLNQISRQQESALEKSVQPQEPVQVFSYQIPIADKNQTGKLKIYYQTKSGSKTKSGFRIALLLNLDQLGDMRTDFLLMEKNLNITFFVKNEEIKKILEEQLEELRQAVLPNFSYLLLQVIVSEKKIVEFDTEDLAVVSSQMVDIKA